MRSSVGSATESMVGVQEWRATRSSSVTWVDDTQTGRLQPADSTRHCKSALPRLDLHRLTTIYATSGTSRYAGNLFVYCFSPGINCGILRRPPTMRLHRQQIV